MYKKHILIVDFTNLFIHIINLIILLRNKFCSPLKESRLQLLNLKIYFSFLKYLKDFVKIFDQ